MSFVVKVSCRFPKVPGGPRFPVCFQRSGRRSRERRSGGRSGWFSGGGAGPWLPAPLKHEMIFCWNQLFSLTNFHSNPNSKPMSPGGWGGYSGDFMGSLQGDVRVSTRRSRESTRAPSKKHSFGKCILRCRQLPGPLYSGPGNPLTPHFRDFGGAF